MSRKIENGVFLCAFVLLMVGMVLRENAQTKREGEPYAETWLKNSAQVECGDLLTRYAEKPDELEFLKCERGEGQTVLEADYRVTGKKSKDVEAFLAEKYGMGNLKFTCCGWEPEDGKNGQIDHVELRRINPNYSIIISMFASAEKEDKNGKSYIEFDRNKIDYFTVRVKIIEV